MSSNAAKERERPWIMRTYAGHSTAAASNELYRTNLKKGQTGLSVAFDLPTQTGYDPDHPLSLGEVGKVGVPVSHIGDMRALFAGLPLDQMNTSMTINATAPWLLALYIAVAEESGVDRKLLQGTTQNDLVKEYLSRGTYIFPPSASMKLTADVIAYTLNEVPKWNPTNVCSYHLQEAGATPVQELAYSLSTGVAVLDAVRNGGQVSADEIPKLVGRISFFVNAGIRFIEELCKMRAFTELWDRITKERYGVQDASFRRFRYGVQVNSLGLTEQQPENNVQRIVLEMLGVSLSKNARARAIQLPAWNEALGLPRPWDQQWSLRSQQILAFESDLLEYDDIFDGSHVIAAKVAEMVEAAWKEMQEIEARGGIIDAVESGYLKQRLVESNAARLRAIESGRQVVVGVNKFVETAECPLTKDLDDAIFVADPKAEQQAVQAIKKWRAERNADAAKAALEKVKAAVKSGGNIMPPSIEAARAGVTTGEWSAALREVIGEYRAPTGVSGARLDQVGSPDAQSRVAELRGRIATLTTTLGRRPKMLVGKPGLDGHSNGAEQIALKARDVGFEVVYEGIRVTPEQIVASAIEEGVHIIGISILSGSHLALVPQVVNKLRDKGLGKLPIVVGGIIPEADARKLEQQGVARVYTPKDFVFDKIMSDLVDLVANSAGPHGA